MDAKPRESLGAVPVGPDKTIIIVPTRNRVDKLIRFLRSISEDGIPIEVLIGADGEDNTANGLCGINLKYRVTVVTFKEHVGSVKIRNNLIKSIMLQSFHSLLVATDDITLVPGAIGIARRRLEAFPGQKGIIGFRQEPEGSCKAGVVLIGRKVLDWFPDGQLYCPEYYHFAAQELERFGEKMGILDYTEQVLLHHYHPAFPQFKGEMDQTHHEARKLRQEDMAVSKSREDKEYIWGIVGVGL